VKVAEIYIAPTGALVPVEHRIDGFGELRATALVDAARIDPDVLITVLNRHATGFYNLLGSFLMFSIFDAAKIREQNFFLLPGVRKYGI
jgi:hypothetical protein